MDGLEKEFANGLRVVKLDYLSPAGEELAFVYNYSITPTFILFDGEGNEVWRASGIVDADIIRGFIQEINAGA